MKPLLAAILFLLPVLSLQGGDLDTVLGDRGKLLLSDDLSQPLDIKNWHLNHGQWELVDGATRGMELAKDHHPAAIRYRLPLKDAVIQYEVKLDGAKQTTLSFTDEKEHLARVFITATGYHAQKDDHDGAGPDQAVVFPTKAFELKPGEWHTVITEFVGDTISVSLDGASPSAGADPLLATEKATFGLGVTGASASFRHLRVWEATPKSEIEKIKRSLLAK